MTGPTWEEMNVVARRYGYAGHATPRDAEDERQLAAPLTRAVQAAGGPLPRVGAPATEWIGDVCQGRVPLPPLEAR
jgi:hypothetical protein